MSTNETSIKTSKNKTIYASVDELMNVYQSYYEKAHEIKLMKKQNILVKMITWL